MAKINANGVFDRVAAKQEAKKQSPEGYEIPDPTPMQPPLGYVRTPSITERIRDMVRSEHLRRAAEEAGQETFEEADDFEVDDDPEPMSGYENDDIFEPVIPPTAPAPAAAASPPAPVSPAAPASPSTGVPPSPGGGEGAGGPSTVRST